MSAGYFQKPVQDLQIKKREKNQEKRKERNFEKKKERKK